MGGEDVSEGLWYWEVVAQGFEDEFFVCRNGVFEVVRRLE